MPYLRIAPEIKAKAHSLYLANAAIEQIVTSTGVLRGTISMWVTRGGWQAEKAAIQKRINSKIIEKVDAVANVAIGQHIKRIEQSAGDIIDRLANFQVKKASDFVPIASALKTLDDVARRNLGLSNGDQPSQAFHFHAGGLPTKHTDTEVSTDKTVDI